jgi:hypothetical protein
VVKKCGSLGVRVMAVVQVVLKNGGNVAVVEIKFIFKELRSFSKLKLLFY